MIKFFLNPNDLNNAELIRLATQFFLIAAITLFADGMRNVFSGALRGLHDSRAPMKIGILSLWFVSLPIAYIIAFNFNGGPIGLRIGFMSGFIISVFFLWKRIKKKINFIDSDKKLATQHGMPN